jgi:hypothetical protein
MNLISDIVTYVRRIIKSGSNQSISDSLIVDYINRFCIMDLSARIELFDYQTRYIFQTVPNVDQYNIPYYTLQTTDTDLGSTEIYPYPMYQQFQSPCYVNGMQVPFTILRQSYYGAYPNWVQWNNNQYFGDGGVTYTFTLPYKQMLRAHIDVIGEFKALNNPSPANTVNYSIPFSSINPGITISALDATNTPVTVYDSGQFLTSNRNLGLLRGDILQQWSTTQNSVNYDTGEINVTFSSAIPSQNQINIQSYYYQTGRPTQILFYNNVITLRSPPDTNYLVDLTATLTPAAFLSTSDALAFGYMAEYIARGAARKILSDTGDIEQFNFYEPLFREQESLVHIRSQRQITSTRAPTIFSEFNGYTNTLPWAPY